MSEYGVVTAPGEVRMERTLPGPVERVWDYLTASEKRRQWFAGGPMELREGGEVELVFRNGELSGEGEELPEKYRQYEGMVSRGRILRCEPPRVLSFAWFEEDGTDTTVTFELEPLGEEVRLVLTHARLQSREMMTDISIGWHSHLDVLEARLSGRTPPPFWARHAKLEADYRQRMAEVAEPA